MGHELSAGQRGPELKTHYPELKTRLTGHPSSQSREALTNALRGAHQRSVGEADSILQGWAEAAAGDNQNARRLQRTGDEGVSIGADVDTV